MLKGADGRDSGCLHVIDAMNCYTYKDRLALSELLLSRCVVCGTDVLSVAGSFRVLVTLFAAFVLHMCTGTVTQIMLGFVAAMLGLLYLQHRQLHRFASTSSLVSIDEPTTAGQQD